MTKLSYDADDTESEDIVQRPTQIGTNWHNVQTQHLGSDRLIY